MLDSLGWVYFRMGKSEDALRYLLEATGGVKDDPVLYEHLGDVYSSMGNKDAALKAWQKAMEMGEKEEGLKERVEEKIKGLK